MCFLEMYSTAESQVLAVGQLLQPVGRFEVLRDRVVESGDDLVDGFFPRRFLVLVGLDGLEELAQRRLDSRPEAFRHLEHNTATKL